MAADSSTITGENRANFLVFGILFLAGAGLFAYMQLQPAGANAPNTASSQTGLATAAEENAQVPTAQAANPASATADVQATPTPADMQPAPTSSAQYPSRNSRAAENPNAQFPSSGADYYPAATPKARLASSWISTPDGTLMECEVAKTAAQREKGLMGRTYLAPSDCMLFAFERSDRYSFWMEDTLIPLDMVFLDYNFRVADVIANVPICTQNPCPIYEPKTEARYVIEMNAGEAARRGIAEGKAITFASV
ncbi:DUF192 domain-containing protein [Candidatus Micrarchaeota archaeon]|nr:DUF192 domain-containing protein [Candidatus Micrarchaeota archaeon]MBI5176890.1 DUF192 domain-containing protein [Candidatus Micrarchaeota archaeon]